MGFVMMGIHQLVAVNIVAHHSLPAALKPFTGCGDGLQPKEISRHIPLSHLNILICMVNFTQIE